MENLLTKIFVLHILSGIFLPFSECLGVNYGQVGNNLPPPEKAIRLLRSLGITKTRIYDTDRRALTAFANSNIEIIVTVENEVFPTLTDPNQAMKWVYTNIRPYFPATRITGIAVGNEVFTGGNTALLSYLVPAMVNIHNALARLGLDQYIEVSTPNSLAVLQESYPPSAGSFREELAGIMPEILRFLSATRASFWINAYPYFAYKDNPEKIPLDYVLFNPNSGMVDENTNLHYDNMLYAQVDAVTYAMAKMGFRGIPVMVTETGWPSKGDEDEVGANLENAAVYSRNLMARQTENEGTPLRPNSKLEIYLFALFNENMKPGPTSERNYGLFRPNGTLVYNVGVSSLPATSSATISMTSGSTKVIPTLHSNFVCAASALLLPLFLHLNKQQTT